MSLSVNENTSLIDYRSDVIGTNYPVFEGEDTIRGSYIIAPPVKTGVLSHRGIELSIKGRYVRCADKIAFREFFREKKYLYPKGEIKHLEAENFEFNDIRFPAPTYRGSAVSVEYCLQLRINYRIVKYKKEIPIFVVFFKNEEKPTPIHNVIGIQSLLHIEFVFPSKSIDYRGVLVGAAYFIAVKIRITNISLELIREEEYKGTESHYEKKVCLATYEVMDGIPVKGECIPFRFYLGGIDFEPFDQTKRFGLTADHFVRATLIDENGKRYYKKIQVDIVRKRPSDVIVK